MAFLPAASALAAGDLSSFADIMPLPASVESAGGRLPIDASLAIALGGSAGDARLRAAVAGAVRILEQRTGFAVHRSMDGGFDFSVATAAATLVVESAAPGSAVPKLYEDESYVLEISPRQAVLRAATTTGALRGLATLVQLPTSDGRGWYFPTGTVRDRPRFPWRGLLIDVSRHWLPLDVLERQVAGMALAKLNVLHLHLSDDQGFRIESKKFPRLHELGSDGLFYTQDQIRELIAYASARGIRVVPEFDVPGHATSWLVAYPELASGPGPYRIERQWGVFDPVFDPTNEKTYELLDGFFGEMAALFPDAYIHIGGDENNGRQWSANARIQQFIRDHDLKDNAGLHAFFNRRLQAIISRHGKQMIGWDEILDPQLPAGTVVHAWHGKDRLVRAVHAGFASILSNGYYLNHWRSAAFYYDNEPLSAASALTEAEARLIIGGEAAIWTEWTDATVVDARIWPRAAAIAERLWSQPETTDDADMYRRLEKLSRRLEEAGLQHQKIFDAQLRALAGDVADPSERAALADFVAALRPLKPADRLKFFEPDASQFTPLTRLADCVRPDSAAARTFAAEAEIFISGPDLGAPALQTQLKQWRDAGRVVESKLTSRSPNLREAASLPHALADASAIGLKALQSIASGEPTTREECDAMFTALARDAAPQAGVEFAMLDPVRLLVAGASLPAQLNLTPAERRTLAQRIAFPPSAAAQPAPGTRP